MLKNLEINKVLFLDIETVPMVEQWEDLSENWKNLWQKKISYQLKEEETAEEMFYQRAGIMAEFGKIVCISFGMIVKGEQLRVKSFYGDDEKKILEDFIELLNSPYFATGLILCAHNGKIRLSIFGKKDFDSWVNLTECFEYSRQKPWEVQHLDTMELWKFGDYNIIHRWICWRIFGYQRQGRYRWIPSCRGLLPRKRLGTHQKILRKRCFNPGSSLQEI